MLLNRKMKAEGIQVRLNLSTALFLAQLVFLSGIDATSNKVRKKSFICSHIIRRFFTINFILCVVSLVVSTLREEIPRILFCSFNEFQRISANCC